MNRLTYEYIDTDLVKNIYCKLQQLEDIEEELLINPALRFDKQLLQKFRVLQNGNLQQYILYGLIFLVLMLVMTILAEF